MATYWTKKNLIRKRVKNAWGGYGFKYVPKPGYHLVPCDHSSPYIDNCMACAPLWDQVAIPVQFKSLAEFRCDHYDVIHGERTAATCLRFKHEVTQ